jgi:hypothetical protein
LAGSRPPRIIANCVGVTSTLASLALGKAKVIAAPVPKDEQIARKRIAL